MMTPINILQQDGEMNLRRLWIWRLFLWYFSRFKVPLLGKVSPKLLHLENNDLVIRIPLKRFAKNHLQSMYFGALCIGADLAAGLHAYYHGYARRIDPNVIFKSMKAQFLKRGLSDVYFVSVDGDKIKHWLAIIPIDERQETTQRIFAFTKTHEDSWECVAFFELVLSVKPKNR